MTRIESLIAQLVPKGVARQRLGEVADFQRGTTITKLTTSAGSIPVLAGGQTPAYFHSESNRSGENVVVAGSGAYAGYVSFWEGPIWVSDAFTVSPKGTNLVAKYLYYFLKSRQEAIHKLKQGGGVPHVYGKDLAKIEIQLPPIEIQLEIIRILDNFTQLDRELEAELEARKKQYEFYRNQLLTFPEQGGVQWVPMGDICTKISSGGTPLTSNPEFYAGSIPWLRTQEVDFNVINSTGVSITEAGLASSSAKWIPANTVVVAMYGATVAKVAVTGIPMTTNQACANLEVNEMLATYRYVYHWLANSYSKLKALGQGTQTNINAQIVKEFLIAVPPLQVQKHISDSLDRFDALVNDMSSGLPAELNARRKQYEYYRDKLLTFKELEA